MRAIWILLAGCYLGSSSLGAQSRWFGGGAWSTSPRPRATGGSIGLQAAGDHHWMLGYSMMPFRRKPLLRVGLLGSFQFRSIYYEIDKPLPYYPIKSMVPAFQLESVQLNPFLSLENQIQGLANIGWMLLAGPVFSFHGGNYTAVATARTISGNVPFQLYRLSVYRQSLGIPFFRAKALLSFSCKLGAAWRWGIHPFCQIDLGDRSRVWYQVVPDDPVHASTGWLRAGIGSLGLLCSFTHSH